ncbi:hypothetical protein B0F90DRAFT_1028292 [Multifurca ochricompacta]|uniref:Uncharacterized protein n=1 Tax=Multifurca ochricompacta TaxID=376703 RepID=A0AAD4M137_9AGAM|nr:hypothetical protein B0F90DRAFT_1028292 [Multifurca ochricompacta]
MRTPLMIFSVLISFVVTVCATPTGDGIWAGGVHQETSRSGRNLALSLSLFLCAEKNFSTTYAHRSNGTYKQQLSQFTHVTSAFDQEHFASHSPRIGSAQWFMREIRYGLVAFIKRLLELMIGTLLIFLESRLSNVKLTRGDMWEVEGG